MANRHFKKILVCLWVPQSTISMPCSTKGDEQALCSNMLFCKKLNYIIYNFMMGITPVVEFFQFLQVCPSFFCRVCQRVTLCSNHQLPTSLRLWEVVAENLRSATSGLIARIPIRISFYCCPCLLNSFEASLCFRNSCNSKLLTHHTHGPPNFANQEAGVSGTANLSSHFLGRGSSSQHWQVLLPLPHQVSNQLSVSGDCGGARMPSAFFTT